MPSLGEKYDIEMETISKPREEYGTDEYVKLGLPVAPSIMLGEEVVVERSDTSEEKFKSVICEHLGLPPPEPQKKGVIGRFLFFIPQLLDKNKELPESYEEVACLVRLCILKH